MERLEKIHPFAKWIAIYAAILIATILLTGCAGQYWTRTMEPLPVSSTSVTNQFPAWCRADQIGCAVRIAGACKVYVRAYLSPDLRRCVETHERRHCAGDTHPVQDRAQLAVDCGDGSLATNES